MSFQSHVYYTTPLYLAFFKPVLIFIFFPGVPIGKFMFVKLCVIDLGLEKKMITSLCIFFRRNTRKRNPDL